MKVGDNLYCHKEYNDDMDDHDFPNYVTVGKKYIVIGIYEDQIHFYDDRKTHSIISTNPGHPSYWNKYFWDLRELRKNKLKQIESR